jgi:D-proline reductase (dithiol) PrdB
MEWIDYASCLSNMYKSLGFPPYKWSEFKSSPWTPFEKPLDQACVALIGSAGISRKGQTPFDPWAVNDLSFRQIPRDTSFDQLELHDNYFDHRDALKDLNCVFPLRRLEELEKEGFIKSFAPTTISLGMGRMYKRTTLAEETVPRMVAVLKEQATNAVLLVPA